MWLRERQNHVFVIQTLCRMLYSLATGAVASKPGATRWALAALGMPWAGVVGRSLARQDEVGGVMEGEVEETIGFVGYTVGVSG